MSTRKNIFLCFVAVSLLGIGAVQAGEFGMSSGSSLAQTDSRGESARAAAMDPVSQSSASVVGGGPRYLRGAAVEAAPPADPSSTAVTTNDNVANTVPAAGAAPRMDGAAASPTAPARSRGGNRWQSLVPGAIR